MKIKKKWMTFFWAMEFCSKNSNKSCRCNKTSDEVQSRDFDTVRLVRRGFRSISRGWRSHFPPAAEESPRRTGKLDENSRTIRLNASNSNSSAATSVWMKRRIWIKFWKKKIERVKIRQPTDATFPSGLVTHTPTHVCNVWASASRRHAPEIRAAGLLGRQNAVPYLTPVTGNT